MGRDEKIAEIGYPVEVYVWILWVWCIAVLSAAKRWPKDGRIFFSMQGAKQNMPKSEPAT